MLKKLKRTHTEFLKELLIKNIHYNTSKLIILSEYNGINKKIKISNKYGEGEMFAESLLKGFNLSINGSLNKHEYFINMLIEKFPDYETYFKIISKYISNHKEIFIEDKYGICKTTPNSLLKLNIPTIELAVNKTEYFINRAKEIHGDIYDYTLVDYKNCRTKIKIICKEHGIFEQTPDSHLSKRGCKICNCPTYTLSNWIKLSNNSKDFNNYMVYIIKCWNENEEFYKIGRTYRDIKFRMNQIPYETKIISKIEGDVNYIFNLEIDLLNYHKKIKNNKYRPKIKFKGSNECFYIIDLNYINKNERKNIKAM